MQVIDNPVIKNTKSVISRMQKSLDSYKLKPNASEQAIKTQQEIIDRLSEQIQKIIDSIESLIDYSDQQYKRGFEKGVNHEKKKHSPNKYSISKETLRYNSIWDAQQKWSNLY